MAWIILIVAGLIETAWAAGLKYTDGFSKPLPTIATLLGIFISMYLLAVATRSLPIGTAYPVWVGIGAAGTVLLGILLFGEPVNAIRMFFLSMLLIAILGLKVTSGH